MTAFHLARLGFSRLEPNFPDISDCTATRSLRSFGTSRFPVCMITGGSRDLRLAVKDPSALAQPRSSAIPPAGGSLLELLKRNRAVAQEDTSSDARDRESSLDHGTMDNLAEGDSCDARKFKARSLHRPK